METRFRLRYLPSAWARYGVATAFFALALLMRLYFLPVEARLAFATFLPAVVLATYLCGPGPGALVTVLGALAGAYIFSPPYYSWGLDTASRWAALAFLSSSALIGWVVHRLGATSSQLREAMDRLRANEQLLQTVVEDQTEMLFRFDREGRFMFANPAGRRTFGLDLEALPMLTWHVLVSPEERAAVSDQLRLFTPLRPVVRTETQIPGPDGEERWGEFVHHARFNAEGSLTEVQTVGRDVTERRRLQLQLADATAYLQDLYDRAPCGYYSLDANGRFVQANAITLEWLGCSAEELIGKRSPKDFFTAEGVATFNANFPTFLASGHIGPLEFDLVGREGAVRRVSLSASAVRDAAGAFVRSRSVMHDITELARARHEIQTLTRQQEAMLNNDIVGITKLKDRRAVWENRALERMFGYGPGELKDQPARLLYPDEASFDALGASAYPVLARGDHYRAQVQLVRKDGTPIWVDMSGTMISREAGESMWMMLDISAMKEHERKVEQIAFHDALTGLPNRLLLADRLQQAMPVAVRQGSRIAVCFIDLDGFKAVNDRLGHAAGDQLLQVVAQRLQQCVRGNDTVARLGGDEFVLLLTHLQSRDECHAVLDRVSQSIAEPVDIDGDQALVSASMGVAFCPDDGTDGTRLLHEADRAMYAAKKTRHAPIASR